jgi:2-dehydro-3-deoxyglucarate aldolase/4-hydroxy-2-oxoheptanedioate aldolase
MFVKLPSMETIEILGSAGYDYLIIDMEHAPLSVETVYRMIVTAERSNMAALVRVRGHDPATANMLLDAGASGVLIPHCSPYEVAREVMAEMVFPPNGRRGAGGGGRATQWGLDGADEYRRGGDSGVIRVPMIEDPEAVEDIEKILDVTGVDAAFIGQGDLTQTLGNREQAQALVDKALQACLRKGIPASITAYGDDLEARLQQGFKWVAIGADTGSFTRAVRDRLTVARQVAETAAGAGVRV